MEENMMLVRQASDNMDEVGVNNGEDGDVIEVDRTTNRGTTKGTAKVTVSVV